MDRNFGSKQSVELLPIKKIPHAVLGLSNRISSNIALIFFPEAGALPLKKCYEYFVDNKILKTGLLNKPIFSSKLTAVSKCPLHKQIVGLLKEEECQTHIDSKQAAKLKGCFKRLDSKNRRLFSEILGNRRFEDMSIAEFVSLFSEIGLRIPSENPANWEDFDIIAGKSNVDFSSTSVKTTERFREFRYRAISAIIKNFQLIDHPSRQLLNIILGNTLFGQALSKGSAYVIDEAISRGRTLNTIEIVFKSFRHDAEWKIGTLFNPDFSETQGVIDFTYSSRFASPFSNRLDLIGTIIVESDSAFKHYKLSSFPRSSASISKLDKLKLFESSLKLFAEKYFCPKSCPTALKTGLMRFLIFCMVEHDKDIINKCLDLNPYDSQSLVEEVDFYINMPHPFSPLHLRNKYKKFMYSAYKSLQDTANRDLINEFAELSNFFKVVRENYKNKVIGSWVSSYRYVNHELHKALDRVKTQRQ